MSGEQQRKPTQWEIFMYEQTHRNISLEAQVLQQEYNDAAQNPLFRNLGRQFEGVTGWSKEVIQQQVQIVSAEMQPGPPSVWGQVGREVVKKAEAYVAGQLGQVVLDGFTGMFQPVDPFGVQAKRERAKVAAAQAVQQAAVQGEMALLNARAQVAQAEAQAAQFAIVRQREAMSFAAGMWNVANGGGQPADSSGVVDAQGGVVSGQEAPRRVGFGSLLGGVVNSFFNKKGK